MTTGAPTATEGSIGDKGKPGIKTVLVDTTLLIEQQKRARYATPVRQALESYRFKGMSAYSKLEFKRAWLKKLAYIVDVCEKAGVANVLDAQDYILRKLAGNTYQQRRLQTCLQQLSRFLEIDAGHISERAQLARLRAHCKRAVLGGAEALKELVTAEFTGTGCVRADEPPREQPDGSLDVAIRRCRPGHIQCRIHQFFQENAEAFGRIAAHVDQMDDPSKELRIVRDYIRAAQRSPTHLCNDKNCSKLADAIIAVDGCRMDVFAANNDAEWVPISIALGKVLLNPVRTRVLS